MRTELIKCDACGSEIKNGEFAALTLPIYETVENDDGTYKTYLVTKELDICERCANRFAGLYYQIAVENNRSGIRGICYGHP